MVKQTRLWRRKSKKHSIETKAIAKESYMQGSSLSDVAPAAPITGLQRALACTCDVMIERLQSTCPMCKSRTCLLCGNCTAYRRGWDPGWIEPDMLDQSLAQLLARLQDHHVWLCRENDRFYDDPEASVSDYEFAWMLALWDDLEVMARHVHEYLGCVRGRDRGCPADAPVRCSACLPIGIETEVKNTW